MQLIAVHSIETATSEDNPGKESAEEKSAQAKEKREEDEQEESALLYDFQLVFGLDYSNKFLLGDDADKLRPALALTLDLEYYDFFHRVGPKK